MKNARPRRIPLSLFAIALVAGIPLALALTGSDFEGNDGNLIPDNGGRDWADLVSSLTIGHDEPSGQSDDSFDQEKEDDPEPDLVTGSIPNQKSDLRRFYVAQERIESGGVERDFIQLAWVRANTLGSANMDFEFNQSSVLSMNGVTPVRTEGDLLITFGFSGGNQATLGLSRWTETGPCESGNNTPCWGVIVPLAGVAEGAVNEVPVFDPIEQVTLAEQTFGEAIIDLTAAGIFDREDCVTFGTAFVKSRSSQSFTSSLKDFIKPIDVSVSNCASVTIIKDAIPDDPQTFTFIPSPEIHLGDFDLADDGDPATDPESSRTFEGKFEGSLTVTEQALAGWDLSDVRCTGAATPELGLDGKPTGRVDLNAAIGKGVTCTFENTQRGSITVVKNTLGGDGTFSFTSSTLGGFDLTTAGGTANRTFDLLVPGTYDLNETVPTGWDLTAASCSDGSDPSSIALAPGETVTCTLQNTERGSITVVKNTLGGEGTFSYTSSTLGGFDLTTAGGTANRTFDLLVPGTYDLNETVPTGWDLTAASCSDGSDPSSIALAPGETVTCTLQNTKRGKITVVKNTVGGDGTFSYTSSTLGNFNLTTSGGNSSRDFDLLLPGTYDLGETVPTGWDLTTSSCSDGSDPGSIGLSPGETVTCTFENTKRGKITVVKNTVGGNGTFSFTSSTLGGFDLTTAAGTANRTFDLLLPGTYDLSETVPTGWDLTASSCSDGSSPGAIGLAPGETVTCTFENTKRGKITVVKNTAGGDGTFSFASSTLGGFDLTTSGGNSSRDFDLLLPGIYDLGETVPTGWDLTASSCSDGSLPDAIGLDPGETVTCTFENTKRGSIVVVKNSLGGDGTFSFTSSTLGGFDLTTTGGTANRTFDLLVPGTYDLSETVPTGWDLTAASCSDGSDPSSIALAPGETVTCTLQNTKRGSITVVKNTLGGDGTFSFTSSTLGGFDLTTTGGTAGRDFDLLVPGTYDLGETVPTGWDLTASSCSDGSLPGSIALDPGETVTCTFENNKRGKITVVKNTLGGDGIFSFTSSTLGGFDVSTSGGTGNRDFDLLLPGTYDLSETVPTGWDLTAASCSDGSDPGSIGLSPGETVTCTFENVKRGKIFVSKFVVNADQPGFDPTEWPFEFDPSYGDVFWLEHMQTDESDYLPGNRSYTVSETVPPRAWVTSHRCTYPDGAVVNGGSSASIDLPAGGEVHCTFTNEARLHPGSSGFWKNWGNHYMAWELEAVMAEALTGSPVYAGLFDPATGVLLPQAVQYLDQIYESGGNTIDQTALREMTSTMLNIGVSQSTDPAIRVLQRNDDICRDCLLDLSEIPGAEELVMAWAPCAQPGQLIIQDVIDVAEATWTGSLPGNWLFGLLSEAEKSVLSQIFGGINQGTVVQVDLSTLATNPTCLRLPGGVPERTTAYEDGDGDGWGLSGSSVTSCDGELPSGYSLLAGDCDDTQSAIHPGQAELCDSLDNNCDGSIDEGVGTTWYADSDLDGFGNPADPTLACSAPVGYVADSTDCNDSQSTVHPGHAELCDSLDNNCDGAVDEGVGTTWHADGDLDGYGDPADTALACSAPSGYVADGTDCNDSQSAVHPGHAELCDSLDNNCDGAIDEGVETTWYADGDLDGYGDPADTALACSAPSGYVADGTDCNDSQSTIHPGQTEVCDLVDNNCDGAIDEGVETTWYADGDLDGYGNPADTALACNAPAGYVGNSTDCDDSQSTIHPGQTEVCDFVDNNCDGAIDEGVGTTWYADSDLDGYGNPADQALACDAPTGYVADGTDCNDSESAVHPGHAELCDSLDNNCNGAVDEGVGTTWYADSDLDGYGNPADPTLACDAPTGYVADGTDCNDSESAVHPGHAELCDSLDNNCNGTVDDGVGTTWYADSDLDGYGNPADPALACDAPTGYVADGTDCNDSESAVHPGHAELCDSLDNNCNGTVDDGVGTTWYADSDLDGYGNPADPALACDAPTGYVADGTDCNDSESAVHPGHAELCDSLDNNCNGTVDDGVGTTWYADSDLDGYGNPADPALACDAPTGYVADGTDCNDSESAVHPGHAELCDSLDNNCNGTVDEGSGTMWYPDADYDGYGVAPGIDSCGSFSSGYATVAGDCDDANWRVKPGAREVCNTIDDNCDGLIDESALGEDSDGDSVHNLCDVCPQVWDPGQADEDADAVGSACDNCPALRNPTQSDSDVDGEGDLCDLDDGVISLFFSSPSTLEWDSETGLSPWNCYRGDLTVLQTTGRYTQTGGLTVPGSDGSDSLAAAECGLTDPLIGEDMVPEPGKVAFYLVTGMVGVAESDLGQDGSGTIRPNHGSCP